MYVLVPRKSGISLEFPNVESPCSWFTRALPIDLYGPSNCVALAPAWHRKRDRILSALKQKQFGVGEDG
jgi:hypothetical protein